MRRQTGAATAMEQPHSSDGPRVSLYVAGEIRAEMARQRLSQAQVGKALGLSQAQMSARLSGHVVMDIDELAAVAGILRRPLGQFIPGDPSPMGPGPSAGISASRHLTLLPGVSSPPHGSNRAWQPPLLAVVGG